MGPQPNPFVTVTLRLCGVPLSRGSDRFLNAGGRDGVRARPNRVHGVEPRCDVPVAATVGAPVTCTDRRATADCYGVFYLSA